MYPPRSTRTLALAAFLGALFVGTAPAKILGSARSKAKKIAKRHTIGKRRAAKSPRSSRRYNGVRTLGRRPVVRVSPYAYGSPYGYGYGGLYGGVGYRGVQVIRTGPVVAPPSRVGRATIGVSTSRGASRSAARPSTFRGRPVPSTYRAPVAAPGRDVSASRVQAARQRFQRRYGFGD